ncbi:MAG: TonB-dependent receptor plug domain-containing protein [Paludibacteraceae bacterium]|nr:TonB-dependent receptor plug domain-containing protein [Paludibacteraceae bacterium]
MRKYLTLLLCVGLSWVTTLKATPNFHANYKSPVCVFRLNNQLTDELFTNTSNVENVSDEFFSKVVAGNLLVSQIHTSMDYTLYAFQDAKRQLDTMAYGNYLLARLNGKDISYDYYSSVPYKTAIAGKDYQHFSLFLYDSLGHVLPDAEVSIEGERIPFNEATQRYEAKKHYDRAKVRILYHGHLSYWGIEKSENTTSKKKTRPFSKFFQTIGRVVKDPVVSILEGEPIGYIAKFARWGCDADKEESEYSCREYYEEYYDYETGEYMDLHELRYHDWSRYCKVMEKCVRRDQRHNRELTSEEEDFVMHHPNFSRKVGARLVTSLPKYKPNDTLRVKAFVRTRKGRPYNRPVQVFLLPNTNGENRKVLLDHLAPYAAGHYTCDIALTDSLKLLLDRKYQLGVGNKRGGVMGHTSFKYEDYVLRDASLTCSYDKSAYYKGDSIRVKVVARDVNGLPFKGVSAKVSLQFRSVDSLLAGRAIYSPILASQTKVTNGEDELVFVFPPSFDAGNNILFRANVSLFLPDGKVEKRDLSTVGYYVAQHSVSIQLDKDSLLVSARYNQKDTVERASIYVEDQLGNRAHLMDTLLPCTLRAEPSYAQYIVKTPHARSAYAFDASSSMASVQWRTSGDSLFPMVANALHLPMACYVVQDGEVIFSGSDKELPAFFPWNREKSYILRAKVLWAGSVIDLEDFVRQVPKDVLRIAVNEPSVIVPGMSCEMEVQVTDGEDKPVKGADVTAYAINSQFKTASPNWNLLGRLMDAPTEAYQSRRMSFQWGSLNSKNYPLWAGLEPIDTIVYYHLHYPARDAIHRYSYYPEDSLTQISPIICGGGTREDVVVAYIDDVPSFIASGVVPYSFAITPNEYHRIRIRTKTAEYTIDSVMVEPYKRTILSVDVNSTSNLVKRKKMADGLTRKEIERLMPYIMMFENTESYAYDWLVREDGTLLRDKRRNSTQSFMGPILDSVRWMTDRFDEKTKVDHRLVYSYDSDDHCLKSREVSKKKFPQLDFYMGNLRLDAELETLDRLLREMYVKNRNELSKEANKRHLWLDYPREKESANSLEITLDYQASRYVVVPHKSELKPSVRYVYGKTQKFEELEAGLYRIYILNKDTSCYRMDSVVVESGKCSVVRFDPNRDRVMDESFGRQLIKKLSYSCTDTEEEELRRNLAEARLVRFLLCNDTFPFVTVLDSLSPEEKDLFDSFEDELYEIEYGVMKKSDLTGTVSIDQALEGRVPGVQASSQPGASPTIMVHGVSSLSGASSPLYVVDGMPVLADASNSALSLIDPADILSMEILKEPSATAIYGSRATSGVVIVKTRKGSNNKGIAMEPAGATLRTHFSDLGFWQPKLMTDKEGKVRYTVTFPDNITRWQTIYLADAPAKRGFAMGSSEGSIKSFVPLSARLYLPEFLVRGDACWVHGTLTNYLQDTVQLTSSFSVNDSLKVTHPHRCAAALTDSLLLHAPTNNLSDTISVTYQFVSENHFGDGERRKVKLLPQGTSCTEGRFAVLHDTLQISLQSEKADSVTIRIMDTEHDLLQDEVAMLKRYPYGCNEQTTSKLIGFLTANQNPEITNHQRRENERRIDGFVKTLKERQLPNGLWGWWGSDSPSVWISRYIVETLQKYQIDFPKGNVKYTCNDWLKDEQSTLSEKVTALTILRSLGENLDYKTWVDSLDMAPNLTLHDRLELAELKTKCGLPADHAWLNQYRRETMKGGLYYQFGDDRSVDQNEVMNTLQVYRIFQADSLQDHRDDLRKMRDYFFYKKSLSRTSYWRNTYESAMIVRTLSDAIDHPSRGEKNSLQLDGALREKIQQFPYERKVAAEGSLSLYKQGDAPVYVSVSSSYWDRSVEAKGNGFSIRTHFSDSVLTVGEQVKMRVVVTVEKDAEYVLLHVPIPAGCTYASKETSRRNNEVYREHYKEHTNIFCSYLKTGTYEFTIELSPYCAGDYILNPAKVEQMYFPEFNGCEAMKRVRIVGI